MKPIIEIALGIIIGAWVGIASAADRVSNDDGIRFYNCGPYGVELGAMDEPFINSELAIWLCNQIELLSEDTTTCAGNTYLLKKQLRAAKKLLRKKKKDNKHG